MTLTVSVVLNCKIVGVVQERMGVKKQMLCLLGCPRRVLLT